jgi:hypothetical protein
MRGKEIEPPNGKVGMFGPFHYIQNKMTLHESKIAGGGQ